MNPFSNRCNRALLWCAMGLLWASGTFAQTATNVMLGWNPSPASSVAGYNVYCGGASQAYTNMVSLGNVTNVVLNGLAPGTTYFFSVTAVDTAGLESPYSNEISYSVPTNTIAGNAPIATNTPPVISSVANQTINLNTTTGPLAFMIGDAQTPATNLNVSASSSNPSLVPAANIGLSGNGSVWTITVTPAAGQTGTATIALSVCDPSLCTTTNFLLTVVPLPTVVLTSPVNGTSYGAPASINLAASVTANGHTISAVQFLNGSNVLGQVSSAPYTFSWNNVAAGNYTISAVALYDAGSIVSCGGGAAVSVAPAASLPLPWQTADIGNPGCVGNAVSSNATLVVQGAGNISGSSDNFRFLYQNLTGDGEIRAQISSAQNTGSGDLTGAMVRESLTSGSRYALMGLSPANAMRWQRRSNTGNGTSSSKGGNGTLPNVWVRVVRSGNTLSGYKSADGVNWSLVNSANITMATNIYVGVAVASGCTNLTTSLLSNVMVVP